MALPKIDFKPENTGKITLFANKGEAIVFWISVAALIFLAMLYIFRYFSGSRETANIEEIDARQTRLELQIDSLKAENDRWEKQIEDLKNRIEELQNQTE